MNILTTRTVWQGWLTLRIAAVRVSTGKTIEREFITPRPAVAVLPYDRARRCALLVEQFRPAVVYDGGPRRLLEAAAGQVDEGETPEAAVRREALEEMGVQLTALEPVADAWTSPGPSSERIALYLSPYDMWDRVATGGGASGEHEELEVLETPLRDLWSRVQGGHIRDLKTLALVLALRVRIPSLFD